MSTTSIVVLVVVIVVVLALLAVLATVMGRRRTERRRERAGALRHEAAGQAPVVHQREAVAREHESEAQEKRVIADTAEARAAESRQAATQERAELEDKVRTADRIDPEVDHRSRDYEPTPAERLDEHRTHDQARGLDAQTPAAVDPARHREPDTTSGSAVDSHDAADRSGTPPGLDPTRQPGSSSERGAPGPVGAEPPVDPDYDRGVPADPLDPDGPPPRR